MQDTLIALPGPRDPAGTSSPLTLGLIRIGPLLLALPVDNLREVIACPAELAPLPAATPGLCGAVQLRGSVIPVLDLRQRMGLPHRVSGEAVIVLMRHGGRLLGLLADAVEGMASVPRHSLHALSSDSDPQAMLATHGFELHGGVANLLDPARIAALPGVPLVDEAAAEATAVSGPEQTPFLLFDCQGLPLGIDAMAVDATVPPSPIHANALRSELCLGVVEHNGREIPVIDTLAMLGLGCAQPVANSAVLVLRFPEGPLGLRLDAVRDIAHLRADDVLPMKGLGSAALLRGMLDPSRLGLPAENNAAHLLLNLSSMWADPLLRSLSSMSQPLAARTAHSTLASAGMPPVDTYLSFRAGIEIAAPLAQLGEIILRPAAVLPIPQSEEGVVGWFSHRGEAVPLVCLTRLMSQRPPVRTEEMRVLLVPDEGRHVGLLVESLCSIEKASWEQTREAVHKPGSLAQLRTSLPLVEVGHGTERRTLPRLDVARLLRAMENKRQAIMPARLPQAELMEMA